MIPNHNVKCAKQGSKAGVLNLFVLCTLSKYLRLVIISHSKSFIKKITKINNVQQKKQGRNKKSRPQTCLEGGA